MPTFIAVSTTFSHMAAIPVLTFISPPRQCTAPIISIFPIVYPLVYVCMFLSQMFAFYRPMLSPAASSLRSCIT
ncbi:hypothetical protein BD626DRAFT_483721 [Schizophyllum amplum]|uniref:Uncharacterized protein n=1 Tax=Schizophyllum amplum TaxID=97359 RepID=A0A550CPM9_9AGAR|nr:hypothetical protein BD626DRAFT_483721 [Auriculariopsis ampla]